MNATDAVAAAVEAAPEALFVSSLGTATSALRLASNDGAHLYLGGAMGSGLAAALGVADRCPSRWIVAVIGDGDLLMGAGALWSLAGLAPVNLTVLVLEDGLYSTTGGQKLIETESLGAVLAAFPALSTMEAETSAGVAEAIGTIERPGIVLAKVAEQEWPGPSPFVDPTRVRARFAERAGQPGASRGGRAARVEGEEHAQGSRTQPIAHPGGP